MGYDQIVFKEKEEKKWIFDVTVQIDHRVDKKENEKVEK